ncbi:MAG: toprim domain-containing protein [Desulfobacteraceae bacterium]|nr:toprim domain-containing protein [Desulfobacteraceae bacterium]
MTPEEILKEQNIEYREKGKDLIIQCLNPKHEDSNPSMRVDSQTGIFHCFSCNAKGNLFTRFNKILNTLSIKQQSILDMIYEIGAHKLSLPTDAEIFDQNFRTIRAETFNNFGVFKSASEFEGRVVLPITNFKGDIVSFIGRYQYSDLKPKYLVRPHGKSLPLYPAAIDIDSESLIIVEGMFDLLNLYDKGLTNVITSFGLISPAKKDKYNTKLHDKFMPYKIAGVNTIYIMYDGDEPGLKAAQKLARALEDFINVDVIELPEGLDPGAMTQDQVNQLKVQLYKQERTEEI